MLVPLDGSRNAEQAIPFAVELAQRSGAVIDLALCYTPHASALFPEAGVTDRGAPFDRRRERFRTYLQQLPSSLGLEDVILKPQLIETSNVAGALCALARASDLIVLATPRVGTFQRWWGPSLDSELVHGQPRPVILLPASDSQPGAGGLLPKHLLVPLSGRPSSEAILEPAALISGLSRGRTTLLHVEDQDDEDERFAYSNPRCYLNWACREFQKLHPHVTSDVVGLNRNLMRTVTDYAASHQAHMVAVSSRSCGWLSGRSLADRLLTSSNIPLLVTRG